MGSQLLTGQLLYCVYTYLLKDYHEEGVTLLPFQEGIGHCYDKALVSAARGDNGLEILSTLAALRRMAEVLSARNELSDLDTQGLWAHLRVKYADRLPSHESVSLQVFMIAYALEKPATADWERVLGAWDVCQSFVLRSVLPALRQLRDLFENYYFDRMSPTDVERLAAVFQTPFPRLFSRFTEMLCESHRSGMATISPMSATRHSGDCESHRSEMAKSLIDARQDEWNWWRGFFLAGGGYDLPTNAPPAKFARIVHGCPAVLGDAISRASELALETTPTLKIEHDACAEQLGFHVFCDFDLLVETILHVLGNAVQEKHRSPECPSCYTPRIRFGEPEGDSSDPGLVKLGIWNDGTQVTSVPGQGYAILNKKLNAFHGRVTGSAEQGDWSYHTSIMLWKWTQS